MMKVLKKDGNSILEWYWKDMPPNGFVFFEMSPLSKFKLIKDKEVILTLLLDTSQKNHLTFDSPNNGKIYVVAVFKNIKEIPEGEYDYHLYISYNSNDEEPVIDYSGKLKVVND
jgi:hypothetical protein